MASICTGVFVLAAAGLLDGRCVTTHWQYARELAEAFPQLRVHPSVLFIDEGPVLTSAGVASGLDLCLHLIRTDHGAAVANTVARLAVVAPVRPGGQAQFIDAPVPSIGAATLDATRAWALTRLSDKLTLADLAAHANVSVRTLNRRFRAETGLSPLQWLLQLRIDRARELLETTDLPMHVIAHHTGIGTVDSLRDHVIRSRPRPPSRGGRSDRGAPRLLDGPSAGRVRGCGDEEPTSSTPRPPSSASVRLAAMRRAREASMSVPAKALRKA